MRAVVGISRGVVASTTVVGVVEQGQGVVITGQVGRDDVMPALAVGGDVDVVGDPRDRAQGAGRVTARRDKSEHSIDKKDGSLDQRNSYGNDPQPPEGGNPGGLTTPTLSGHQTEPE